MSHKRVCVCARTHSPSSHRHQMIGIEYIRQPPSKGITIHCKALMQPGKDLTSLEASLSRVLCLSHFLRVYRGFLPRVALKPFA